MKTVELLVPAKDLNIGIAAIDSGADAVYIGGPNYGARVNASNSIDDIASLCQYAHKFGVKIHVTVNTILYDSEINQVQETLWQLYNVGVDAIIIQDLGLLELELPPFEIHASTQQNNSTPEKIKFLEQLGFHQVVLARELSLEDIKKINQVTTNVKLEYFVHGALCVGVNGRCYLSQCITGRSANRGECAQLCRVKQSLRTINGEYLAKDKYLLSMRDLNNSDNLQELIDAGISSFKVEGRLKDELYVRNVTAYYRKKIDEIIMSSNGEITRSSYGKSAYTFEPNLNKCFNRGFTEYNLHSIKDNYANFDSPKHVGEKIGVVERKRNNILEVKLIPNIEMHNGDKCNYFKTDGELDGFRVSSVINKNNLDVFQKLPEVNVGTILYRNVDANFESKVLTNGSCQRKLLVDIDFIETENGFLLKAKDESNRESVFNYETNNLEISKNPTKQQNNIKEKLQKLGNTIFSLRNLNVNFIHNWFIPISIINDARHKILEEIISKPCKTQVSSQNLEFARFDKNCNLIIPEKEIDKGYKANIANEKAKVFYERHGVESTEPAYEIKKVKNAELLFTKHCLRYCFGMCSKRNLQRKPEKLELIIGNHVCDLEFDCKNCFMIVRDSNKTV